MSPVTSDIRALDDFIPTISDDDSLDLFSQSDVDSEIAQSERPPSPNKKRKHDQIAQRPSDQLIAQPGLEYAGSSGRKRSKITASHNAKKLSTIVHQDEESEAVDDGAMNSDFEFQNDDPADVFAEELDGWDLEEIGAGKNSTTSYAKKGVDLDQLISRRLSKSKSKNSASEGFDARNIAQTSSEREEEEEEEEGDDNEERKSDGEAEQDMNDEEGEDEDEQEEVNARELSVSENEDDMLADDVFGMNVSLGREEKGDDPLLEPLNDSASDSEAIADPMPEPDDSADSGEESDAEEEERRKAFFASEDSIAQLSTNSQVRISNGFQAMSLSRPILRGLASVGFTNPTPIQTKTIPVALLGKDVVGGAVTGSGKTAAFIIPILERLIYRPKKVPTSRVAILMPTRELAVQCFKVASKLASFTDITFTLLTGGFSLREQENLLKKRPDVIIATPGRFIDHMRNSPSFTVDTLEILVLDEADRMLDDGFADELDEILKTIPNSRQTMLFSATMTEKIDKLIRAGLKKPVRLMADPKKQTVGTLIQEFVRLRPGREQMRLACLMHLCSSIYKERVIVFFRQKKEAHRARVVFGLCGIKAGELHGNMSQEQRMSSLMSFRNGQCTHLLATDLASRGLDIPLVSVVINYEAPQTHEIYLHRVGRTARAGRHGRSCTIAAESDRKVVKEAVRAAKAQGAKIASRAIDAAIADEWNSKVTSLEEEIGAILKEEKEEKLLSQSDVSIRKGENMIRHENEIQSRPKRTWFETEKDKLKAKKAGKEELNGRVGLGKGKIGGKLSAKDKKSLDDKRERLEGRVWKKGKGSKDKSKSTGGIGSRKGKHSSKPRNRSKSNGK